MKNDPWYDNLILVEILLFLFFPLGLYAVYKTNKIKFKLAKILYGLLGLISFLLIITYVFRNT